MMDLIKKERFLNGNRIVFLALALLLTSLPVFLFVDLMYRTEYEFDKLMFTLLFTVLMANVAWGATHALMGFILRRFGVKAGRIEASIDGVDLKTEILATTAITLPVYNEDPKRVFAGVRSMVESLAKTGKSEYFDFFILSDSTNSERWIEEEEAWATLCRDIDGYGHIHYRRRLINKDRKAGNLHDFCENWGSLYRYMVTMDADSIMSGEDLVKLTAMMERNPQVGIIQTAPRIVYGESFWGRIQQFANRFYGPVFLAGLNFWQQGDGNYWGHNAIIRLTAFMDYCALPDLPGKEPFGGKILSHDFVEAALMRKAGYEVWLARELGGSYEEGPQDLVEHLTRDRRWCQGNMQHIWLLFSKGLMPGSRAHLANGIMSYAASLLWLIYLILGAILAHNQERSQLTVFPRNGFFNAFEMSLETQALWVAGITFFMLFLGKILALLDGILTRNYCRGFGGIRKAFYGVCLESLVSIFVAPIFMIYHSRFVVSTAMGKGVGWKTQKRGAGEGLSLSASLQQHWGVFLIGAATIYGASQINVYFFWWLSPVWLGLFLIPLTSCWLSKPALGKKLLSHGLLVIPEEWMGEPVLEACKEYDSIPTPNFHKLQWEHPLFMRAIADPYVNAIRIHMAKETDLPDRVKPHPNLRVRLLQEGAAVLSDQERKSVLRDPEMLELLYQDLWIEIPDDLHASWKGMINSYGAAAHF
jgi:membrane glycosyltransferase